MRLLAKEGLAETVLPNLEVFGSSTIPSRTEKQQQDSFISPKDFMSGGMSFYQESVLLTDIVKSLMRGPASRNYAFSHQRFSPMNARYIDTFLK